MIEAATSSTRITMPRRTNRSCPSSSRLAASPGHRRLKHLPGISTAITRSALPTTPSGASDFGKFVAKGNGADGNNNGVVDAADYVVWRNAATPGFAAAVPEPTTLAMLFGVLLAVISNRSRNAHVAPDEVRKSSHVRPHAIRGGILARRVAGRHRYYRRAGRAVDSGHPGEPRRGQPGLVREQPPPVGPRCSKLRVFSAAFPRLAQLPKSFRLNPISRGLSIAGRRLRRYCRTWKMAPLTRRSTCRCRCTAAISRFGPRT